MGKKARAKASKQAKKAPKTGREAILVSLQESTSHVEEVGAHHPADRVLAFANDVLPLAVKDDAALAPFGFDADWRTFFQAALEEAGTKAAARVTTPAAAGEQAQEVDTSIADAHAWTKLYKIVCGNSGPAIRKAAPKVGHHSHARKTLAAALKPLADFIEEHADETERHGGGSAFANKGYDLAARLKDATATHNFARKEVPTSVREMHQAVGLVYLELSRLAHAADGVLPHDRAKAYLVEQIDSAAGHRTSAAKAPTTQAPGKASPGTPLSGK